MGIRIMTPETPGCHADALRLDDPIDRKVDCLHSASVIHRDLKLLGMEINGFIRVFPKIMVSPENRPSPKERIVFQLPTIHVQVRKCKFQGGYHLPKHKYGCFEK